MKNGEYWNAIRSLIDILGKKFDSNAVKNIISQFHLRRDELSGIVYFENEEKGISLECEDNTLRAVFLFAECKDGFSQYKGSLFGNIDFGITKKEVWSELGCPAESGMSEKVTSTLEHGGWDKYNFDIFSVHFTYSITDCSVELITLEQYINTSGQSLTTH
jgi:hypothetical protein